MEEWLAGHLPQVRIVAKRVWQRTRFAVELDDLISLGMVGLLNAIRRYDPSRGTLLKTYAEHRIRGAILDGLREMDWMPRSARDREKRKEREKREAEQKIIASNGGAAVNKETGPERRGEQSKVLRPERSPGMEFVFAAGDLRDLERMAERTARADATATPESLTSEREQRDQLARAIAQLPERQRSVIALYYHRDLSMKQIARALGVHESRVSQIHTAAIRRLQSHFGVSGNAVEGLRRPSSHMARFGAARCFTAASQSAAVSTPMVSSAVSAT